MSKSLISLHNHKIDMLNVSFKINLPDKKNENQGIYDR